METLKILNKKEVKKVLNKIKEQYGIENLDLNYVFLKNNEDKIFITNRDIERIDFEKLKINNIGLYFCKIEHDEPRLTIEGSQIVGKSAKKNVVELNDEQTIEWINGGDISSDADSSGFVILKHNNDFLGTGRFKNNKIINFLPNERRVKF